MDQWGDGWAVLEQASELKRQGEAFALATVVWRQGPTSGKEGCRAIITASGELHGWIGGACSEPIVIREARQVIAEGVPRLLLLGTNDQFGGAVPEGMAVQPITCQSEGALEVYIEPVIPTPHLVVIGRSPMAHALVEMAQALGWRTDLVDSPEFSADFSLKVADEQSMVVVATQGHGDEEALEAAVGANPAYVGLVASRKRGDAVLGYLGGRGITDDQRDRVKVPAGLDLGRTSHREMAVGILAELVQLRASGALAAAAVAAAPGATATSAAAGSTAGTTGSTAGITGSTAGITGSTAGATPVVTEAIDPICGMTVTVGPGTPHVEYEGNTYYFCCAGCRREFEQDPAAHVKEDASCS
jgi:xanthine dehydrogenase accessory factor